MSKTLICIQLCRMLIILLTSIFIVLSACQMLHFTIIPWPHYHHTVFILLDLVLVLGLIASLIQHLKTLILFSWLIALTFLLIFFGNTVSTQYQSDLLGMVFLLLICILAFTDAVCIIKYRMPSEEAHHPFIKCSQQQLFEQADSLPLPPPAQLVASRHTSPPPPPPPLLTSHHGHSVHHHGHSSHSTHPAHLAQHTILPSPTSPLPPHSTSLNSHCYAPKNDPQFHAV